ncbi:kelch-like protein [NY_014 poxvirus]|uniref:kelch-like protein n=1 Tax=NY_014 poxvirus TaxID=2025360 RepID=UPI000B99FCCA|nr:kelch-like protein [NY_014 poxvirus]AST09584.1 kelch-like protein [NY_014 poxvirus]
MSNLKHHNDNRVVNNINKLFNNSELCDVVIYTSDDKIYAHKLILAAGSEYFRTIFESYINNQHDIAHVYLPMFSKEIVNRVIMYLYGNNTVEYSYSIDMLKCADYLLIDDLIKDCDKCIDKYMYSKEDSILIYNELYYLEHVPVVKYIKSMILNEIMYMIYYKYFLKINFYALLEILSDNDIVVTSEDFIAIVAMVWLGCNNITEENTLKLISCVNIRYLSDYIKNRMCINESIKIYQSCLDYICNNDKYQAKPLRRSARNNVYLLCYNANKVTIFTYNFNNNNYIYNSTFNHLIYNYGAAIIDNELIIAGGMYNIDKLVSNNVYKLDIKTNTWVSLPPMIVPRSLFSLEVIGKTIYAIGGQSNQCVEGSIECYTMGNDSWKMVSKMNPLSYYTSCAYGNYIYRWWNK